MNATTATFSAPLVPVDDLLCDLDALLAHAGLSGRFDALAAAATAAARTTPASAAAAAATEAAAKARQSKAAYKAAREAFEARLRQLEDLNDSTCAAPVAPAEAPADLAAPGWLTPWGDRAYHAILDVLRECGLTFTGGCRAFYSPSEWVETGHRAPDGPALLVVSYDGGVVGEAFKADGEHDARAAQKMEAALTRLGLYSQELDHVSSAIYRAR